MEAIFEIVAELYLGLVEAFLPDKKINKFAKFILQFFCVIISLAILLMIFFGVMMLVDPTFADDDTSVSPWLLIGIGAGLVLIQIGIVVFTEIKKKKKIDSTAQETQKKTEEEK